MIAYLDGKCTYKEPTYVIIDVGGVGYQVKISLTTWEFVKNLPGERCRLHTFLHIKEDAHTLYGFSEAEEKALFLHLISISGVGPGTAVMILSSSSASELAQAIVTEDVRFIQGIKGVGPKTAQRIVLELKDKLKKDSFSANGLPLHTGTGNTNRTEALSALVTLGIAKAQAEKTLDAIIKKEGTGLTVEDLIKRALKSA